MIQISAFAAVFLTTLAGVEIYRRWSLHRELLDIPNERSSHDVPTPRGGGVVIAAVALSTLLAFTLSGRSSLSWQFFAGALIVAAISLADDVRGIHPFLRLAFHLIAALLVVSAGGGFASVNVPFSGAAGLGTAGDVLAVIWIVWLINAYNFMDGIDGIAGLQAVTAGMAWTAFGLIYGSETVVVTGGVMVAAAAGFLVLNWQPAKIFMGDVGSAFLGFAFAALPVFAARADGLDGNVAASVPLTAVLFVWFFVADTVRTLFRRLLRGEKVWLAHREHFYQYLIIGGRSHSQVTLLYGGLSMLCVGFYFGAAFAGLRPELIALPFAVVIWVVFVAVFRAVPEKRTDG